MKYLYKYVKERAEKEKEEYEVYQRVLTNLYNCSKKL